MTKQNSFTKIRFFLSGIHLENTNAREDLIRFFKNASKFSFNELKLCSFCLLYRFVFFLLSDDPSGLREHLAEGWTRQHRRSLFIIPNYFEFLLTGGQTQYFAQLYNGDVNKRTTGYAYQSIAPDRWNCVFYT